MHQFKTLIILVIACLSACSLTPTNLNSEKAIEYSNQWETLDTIPYKGKRDDISFASSSHGWYGTGKGDLYSTNNSGETWELVSSHPGTFIRALGFINETTGFIGNVGTDYYPGVTDETPLYRTDDAGKTWSAIDLGNKKVKGICAIDIIKSELIYQGVLKPNAIIHAAGRVGGPTGIIRSIDNGLSWDVIDMSKHAGMILDIKFFNEDIGLVFASTSNDSREAEGLILRTTDGGQSWEKVYQSGRPMELIWKASFPDHQNGYATVQSYDQTRQQQIIIKTTDNGQSWKEIPMTMNASARQFGIGFIDKDHGWVGTFDGGFYTSNGGKSFEPAPVAKAANKFRIIPDKDGINVFAIGTQVQKLQLQRSNQN